MSSLSDILGYLLPHAAPSPTRLPERGEVDEAGQHVRSGRHLRPYDLPPIQRHEIRVQV